MAEILFAHTTVPEQTHIQKWEPIPNLMVLLPAANVGQTRALIILCLPNAYATGNDYPGSEFGIAVNGVRQDQVGCFTYDSQNPQPQPQCCGRRPVTLVVEVPLVAQKKLPVQALWHPLRGSTVIIDTPASMSAIIL